MQPIRVQMAPPGPNPWKIVHILEELKLPYEIISCRFENVKKKPFIDLNPNGRFPAIEDPNSNLTLWETGAIVQYLIEQYDAEKKFTFDTITEKHHANQWLMFQVSGQGPYFGQASWFNVFHHEQIPSVKDRYNNEVLRILSVLEGWLASQSDALKTSQPWLVGNKLSFADLAFVTWNDRLDVTAMNHMGKEKFEGFPRVQEWHERMANRESWKKAMRTRARLMEEQGLDWNGMPKGVKNMKEYEERIKREAEAVTD